MKIILEQILNKNGFPDIAKSEVDSDEDVHITIEHPKSGVLHRFTGRGGYLLARYSARDFKIIDIEMKTSTEVFSVETPNKEE